MVGILGTDSVTRSQESLVAKCRSLQQEGVSCWHWCGSYRLPPATVTGGVVRELVLVEGCLGVGEVAVSDHRGCVPTPHQLAVVASEARVGGEARGSTRTHAYCTYCTGDHTSPWAPRWHLAAFTSCRAVRAALRPTPDPQLGWTLLLQGCWAARQA